MDLLKKNEWADVFQIMASTTTTATESYVYDFFRLLEASPNIKLCHTCNKIREKKIKANTIQFLSKYMIAEKLKSDVCGSTLNQTSDKIRLKSDKQKIKTGEEDNIGFLQKKM